jgi:hypothetical protein
MPTNPPALDAGISISARHAAESEPLCSVCVQIEHQGLCPAHIPHVCPTLKEPGWYRLVGTVQAPEVALPDESPATLKAKRRTARRIERAMRGEFTKTRPARVAA